MKFELLVAIRYLRAKREQTVTVISTITLIAILGVAAGVAALVVAMAVSEGQREDIRDRLLVAQSHLTILGGPEGIPNYEELTRQIESVEGVVGAAPHAETQGAIRPLEPVLVKGILPDQEARVSQLHKNIKRGQLTDLTGNSIAVGKELADKLGLDIGDDVFVMSAETTGGPAGPENIELAFKVVAIYSIGLYEYDSHLVFVPFDKAVRLVGAGPVATSIEVKVDDIDRSTEVGQAILQRIGERYDVADWKDTHRTIFQALKLERLGMAIAISLIVFVAALNIVAMLTMMVLEKARSIAMLIAMGATRAQIRRIFMLQGVIIGVIGTCIGLVVGHGISYFADKYELIQLSAEVYSIDHLPFHAVFRDSVLIAAGAILISFVATLYPSATAARVEPVEALRYE
ncbi:MAG TPA: FtsX-like permease family protein [Terriglobia bacterium]|nr:FtsX-like permease family protein [Terriglobia bacterium]